MSVLSIVKDHIVEDAYNHQAILEGRKKQGQSSSTPKEPEGNHEGSFKMYYDSKFNRNIAKLSKNSSTADLDKIDRAIDQLKATGKIEAMGGIHSINQPIFSERDQKKISGWRVLPISRKNEIRLAFKNHGDGTVEVKFGRAKDIGYTH